VIRRFLPSAVTIVLSAATAAICLAAPAGAEPAGSPPAAAAAAAAPAVQPRSGLQIHLSPASLAAAAGRCARWATNAGFANDGYTSGGLTTAIAIALAESGCSPRACFDDSRHRSCTERSERRSDSVDRGAWQINSRSFRSVSNRCAFSGQCAADAAYTKVSAVGTYFGRWTTYSIDAFAAYLWAAQRAVSALRRGTVTSALAGSCLGYPADRRGQVARLENCGTPAHEIWRVKGSTLRTSGGLCLAATSRRRSAVVRLARCSRSKFEAWQGRSDAELYNAGAHRCLSDRTGADRPGLALTATACSVSRHEAWFRP
jgi:Lysozyme like domain/Ricin-type beta-trefoil lectin domain